MADRLLDVSDVAAPLKVPASFIYARTRTNAKESIPHLKIGKYLRFDPRRLAEWIAAHERGGARALEVEKASTRRKPRRTIQRRSSKKDRSRTTR
jgi:hypothetical protein